MSEGHAQQSNEAKIEALKHALFVSARGLVLSDNVYQEEPGEVEERLKNLQERFSELQTRDQSSPSIMRHYDDLDEERKALVQDIQKVKEDYYKHSGWFFGTMILAGTLATVFSLAETYSSNSEAEEKQALEGDRPHISQPKDPDTCCNE